MDCKLGTVTKFPATDTARKRCLSCVGVQVAEEIVLVMKFLSTNIAGERAWLCVGFHDVDDNATLTAASSNHWVAAEVLNTGAVEMWADGAAGVVAQNCTQ